MKRLTFLLLGLLFFLAAVPAQAGDTYRVTNISDLGTPWPSTNGPQGFSFSINDIGQVAGYVGDYNTMRPFTWLNGVTTMINLISGTTSSQPVDINNKGEVLLWGRYVSSSNVGSLWSNGTHTLLGDLPGGYIYTLPTALNEATATQAVGYSYSSLGQEGFIWENGSMTALGLMPSGSTYSYVYDINDSGTLVGHGSSGGAFFRKAGGTATVLPPPVGYQYCQAWAINNQGIAVGNCMYQSSMNYAAVWWDTNNPTTGQTFISLSGGVNSWACDINDLGVVAGQVQFPIWPDLRGVTWNLNDNPMMPTELSTVLDSTVQGITIMHARSINDSGLIVGYGKDQTLTNLQTYLLTPILPARLAADPTSLNFSTTVGVNPSSQPLSVYDALGTGVMTWTVDSSASWLTVAPSSGSGDGTVDVSISVAGLTPGTYFANVTFFSAQADNNYLSVPVTLVVNAEPPNIAFSPASLSFTAFQGGPAPAAQTLTIGNSGSVTLMWTLSSDQNWLGVSPSSGTATKTTSGTSTISVMTDGLTVGTYSGAITISDPNAVNTPQTVPISLTVTAGGPYLRAGITTWDYASYKGSPEYVSWNIPVWNAGTGTLNWTASSTVSWITVSPTKGSSTGPADQSFAMLSFNNVNKPVGTYTGSVIFKNKVNAADTWVITITLTVKDAVKVTAPNGGEYLKYGTTSTVAWWTAPEFNTVASSDLYYSIDGGTTWIFVTNLSGNPGSYQWLIPQLKRASTKCKVKVVLRNNLNQPSWEDISDANFTIGK